MCAGMQHLPSVPTLTLLPPSIPCREDEEALLALSRTFSDAAIAYLNVVIVTDDPSRIPMQTALIGLVMRAASCAADPDISAATFPFWRALENEMYGLRACVAVLDVSVERVLCK